MNWTAVLHIIATVAVGAGLFVSDQTVSLGLFLVAAVLFVGGIVIARRDGESAPQADASG